MLHYWNVRFRSRVSIFFILGLGFWLGLVFWLTKSFWIPRKQQRYAYDVMCVQCVSGTGRIYHSKLCSEVIFETIFQTHWKAFNFFSLTSKLVRDPAFSNIGTKYSKSSAQILYRWAIEHDVGEYMERTLSSSVRGNISILSKREDKMYNSKR